MCIPGNAVCQPSRQRATLATFCMPWQMRGTTAAECCSRSCSGRLRLMRSQDPRWFVGRRPPSETDRRPPRRSPAFPTISIMRNHAPFPKAHSGSLLKAQSGRLEALLQRVPLGCVPGQAGETRRGDRDACHSLPRSPAPQRVDTLRISAFPGTRRAIGEHKNKRMNVRFCRATAFG